MANGIKGVAAAVMVAALVGGCASDLFSGLAGVNDHGRGASHPIGTLANAEAVSGIERLKSGDYRDASRHLNRALRAEPDNSYLHMLNGLAYHAAAGRGAWANRELAETGYLLALKFDPTNHYAAHFLGLLYLDMRRFNAAQLQLLRAARAGDEDPNRYYALAVASYYAQDLELAVWAAEKATDLRPDLVRNLEAAALVNGAAGRRDRAGEFASQLSGSAESTQRTSFIERRLAQWEKLHQQLAQAPAQEQPPTPAYNPAENPYLAPDSGQRRDQTGAPAGDKGPLARNWSDCVQMLSQSAAGQSYGGPSSSYSSSSYGSSGSGSADETTPLPALPAPCAGIPLPRMATVDIVLVKTEEQRNTAQGVNVLDGLQIVLTGSRSRSVQTGTSSSDSRTTTVGIALPSAGITYSLNIANATDARTEVIARPTLLALDRFPSNFFSGANVSVALSGQYGGNISQQPVGVSLSVTPTFVDDETMLIAVKATRSFFESATRGSFSQSLSTTRNVVTANALLKFDQTLILSGMRERDLQESDGGVHLLRDIPVIQYLFGRRTSQDFEKEVLVLLTPRRPTFLDEATGAARAYLKRTDLDPRGRHDIDQARATARRAVSGLTPNITAITAALSDNLFYNEFRTGDLAPPRLQESLVLTNMLRDIRELLAF